MTDTVARLDQLTAGLRDDTRKLREYFTPERLASLTDEQREELRADLLAVQTAARTTARDIAKHIASVEGADAEA